MLFKDFLQRKKEIKQRDEYVDLKDIDLASLTSDAFQDMPILKKLTLDKIIGKKPKTLPENIFFNLEVLEQLIITYSWLSELDENTFQDLLELRELHITYNEFETLPEDIFLNQHELQRLVISINRHTFTLPEHIFQPLTTLTLLYLNDNKIITLPEQLFRSLTNLTELKLDKNNIETLPATLFQGLTHLESLDLSDNKIDTLPTALFQGLISLKNLKLRYNKLQNLPNTVFQGLTNLETLDLSDNKIEKLPATLFQGLTNIKYLNILNNLITVFSRRILSGFPNLIRFHKDPNVNVVDEQEPEPDPYNKEDIQPATTDINLAEDIKKPSNNNILLYACKIGEYADALLITKLMLENNSKNISIQNGNGETALHFIIQNNAYTSQPELYALLLKDFLEKYNPNDECVVCTEPMDGINGPEDNKKKSTDNDVVTVCENSHCLHRKCILGSCRVTDQEHFQPISMNTECPLCKAPLLPNCEGFASKIKLPFPLSAASGGRRRKRVVGKNRKSTQKRRTQKRRTQKRRTQKRGTQKRRTQKRRTQKQRI